MATELSEEGWRRTGNSFSNAATWNRIKVSSPKKHKQKKEPLPHPDAVELFELMLVILSIHWKFEGCLKRSWAGSQKAKLQRMTNCEDTTLKTPPLSPWSTKLPEDGEHTGNILPLFYIFFTSATQTSCCKEKQKDWGTRLDEPLIWSSKGHFVPQPVCESLYICPLFLRGKMKIKQKLFIENNRINFWKIILYKIKQSPL